MANLSPDFDQVNVGDELPELVKVPSHLQLFRYSAITWNSHRIHYDQRYAREEGYPDVLVQSHLHGAFLTQLCTDWMGAQGELQRFSVTVKRYAIPGDTLTCKGKVIHKTEKDGYGLVEVELTETNQNNEVCANGWALIKLRKN